MGRRPSDSKGSAENSESAAHRKPPACSLKLDWLHDPTRSFTCPRDGPDDRYDPLLELRGSVREIELDGPTPGQQDLLRVTGDASLSGGIVRLAFDQYPPEQGDAFVFPEGAGAVSLAKDMRFDY